MRDPAGDLVAGVEAIAREAGELLLRFLGRIDRVDTKQSSLDLVTEADRESEAFIVRRLEKLLPGAAILAEEGTGEDRRVPDRWIVDPLDGTTNFAHRYPVFCVSIALERDGSVILGVVHDPTRDELFRAVRGAGATRNGRPLSVSDADDLGRAVLVTGFPYDVHHAERDNLAQFSAFLKRARAVRRDGSAALDLAYVAAGRFDGFWEEKLAPWDVAAGALLVEEAGGVVTDYEGKEHALDGGNIVAAPRGLHGRMVEVLADLEERGTLPPRTGWRR